MRSYNKKNLNLKIRIKNYYQYLEMITYFFQHTKRKVNHSSKKVSCLSINFWICAIVRWMIVGSQIIGV